MNCKRRASHTCIRNQNPKTKPIYHVKACRDWVLTNCSLGSSLRNFVMNCERACMVLPFSTDHFLVFMIGVSPTDFNSTSTRERDTLWGLKRQVASTLQQEKHTQNILSWSMLTHFKIQQRIAVAWLCSQTLGWIIYMEWLGYLSNIWFDIPLRSESDHGHV